MPAKKKCKRNSIRYVMEDEFIVDLLSLQSKDGGPQVKISGLLIDEAYKGCCGVFRKPFPYNKQEKIQVTIGNLKNLSGQIKWITNIDKDLVKAGIELK